MVGAIIKQAVSDYVRAYATFLELEPRKVELEEMIKWVHHPSLVTVEQMDALMENGAVAHLDGGHVLITFSEKSAMGKIRRCRKDVIELERFFHGDWFALLTDLDPEYLIVEGRKQAWKSLKVKHQEFIFTLEKDGVITTAYSYEEISELLGVSKKHIYSAMSNGYRCHGYRITRKERK